MGSSVGYNLVEPGLKFHDATREPPAALLSFRTYTNAGTGMFK
jgi:hypothetical protein